MDMTVAPDFTAKASLAGKEVAFSLKEARQKGPVVVYFYPSAYTPGCNIQAHTFSVSMADFKAAGASVIGVSLDSIDRLNVFSADPEFCAGNVMVASDPDGSISKAFGVSVTAGTDGDKDTRNQPIGHGYAKRLTFVVNTDGTIAATIGGVPAHENVEKALEEVKKLRK